MEHKIGFIGAGNMARCIIGGLIENNYINQNIWASAPNREHLQQLSCEYGINTCNDNNELITQVDILVLAVKPQAIATAIAEIQEQVKQRKPLIISVAAGITCERIKQGLALSEIAIIRCMPNTGALMQCSATGLFANAYASQQHKQVAESILSAIGICLWFDDEKLIDSVTALSGSGPAYFFLLMEALEQAAQKIGLEPTVARELIKQTALGSAKLINSDQNTAAQLRKQVTSPGGTTEAALQVLAQGDFNTLICQAVAAAHNQAEILNQ